MAASGRARLMSHKSPLLGSRLEVFLRAYSGCAVPTSLSECTNFKPNQMFLCCVAFVSS